MNRGKLIVIEGTDCSGKQTQSDILLSKLLSKGIKTVKMQFPMYDTPTGKIVGGPYLGKDYICDGFFPEGAANVDGKVASLYYAADRLYNIDKIEKQLESGVNVILDRYVESNMAHQAGKFTDFEEKKETIAWIDELEYRFLKLPRPDKTFFLHMPYEFSLKLKEGRLEKTDQHEASMEHLINAEETYLYLADKYNYSVIKCVDANNEIRKIEDISTELFEKVLNFLQ